MHLLFLLNPLVAYGMAAGGMLLSLVLFASIRWEIAKARQETQIQFEGWQTARESDRLVVHALEGELEGLRESIHRLEQIPLGRGGRSINLTKRAQALRMYRRGEPLTSIAAALETPGNEIALLLKIHALTSEASEKVS